MHGSTHTGSFASSQWNECNIGHRPRPACASDGRRVNADATRSLRACALSHLARSGHVRCAVTRRQRDRLAAPHWRASSRCGQRRASHLCRRRPMHQAGTVLAPAAAPACSAALASQADRPVARGVPLRPSEPLPAVIPQCENELGQTVVDRQKSCRTPLLNRQDRSL